MHEMYQTVQCRFFPRITQSLDLNSWRVTCILVILCACAQHQLLNFDESTQRGKCPRGVNLNYVAQVALRAQSELFVEMSSKHTSALCSTLMVSAPHGRIYHASAL